MTRRVRGRGAVLSSDEARREISSHRMRAMGQRFSLRKPTRFIPRSARDGAEGQEQT
jgi:hypothetical protein